MEGFNVYDKGEYIVICIFYITYLYTHDTDISNTSPHKYKHQTIIINNTQQYTE